MHHEVGAERDRLAETGRGEGVVDQQRHAGGVRDLRHLRDVEHFEARIADGLGDDQPGIGPDGGAQAVEIARLDEGGGDAEARQRVREQVDGAAIERGRRHDMVARAQQGRDGEMHRRLAARGADRADALLQRGEPLLQHRGGRVGDAGVDVAGALQVEQRRGVVGVLEHVGRGLVDRHRARAGHRVGLLAGMQAQGLERGRFRSGHAGLAGISAAQAGNVAWMERSGIQVWPAINPGFRRARSGGACYDLRDDAVTPPPRGMYSPMTDSLPDRLSNDPRSPFYDADILARDVGIRFNGAEKTNVEEYCVSEGWVRVAAGKAKDRYGNPLTIKLTGTVEPYFRESKEPGA